MRAAAVQFFATPFALERNLQTVERLAREAAARGAQLIVLPELFNTGYTYTPRLPSAAETIEGPTFTWLKRLSTELKVVLGGAMLFRDAATVCDEFVLVEPDGKIHRYRKQHPFLWERCYFRAGCEPIIAETSVGRLGLLVCWDIAFRSAWEAYRGKVDAILISSAPPRFHRAVLNFPKARKVYVAELVPELLRHREVIDDWYSGEVGRGAAFVGAPVVHSTMAGRFVTALPFPRLSFGMTVATKPRYWSWAGEAGGATLRATFYGSSAVFDARGGALASVAEEEGLAVAEVGSAVTPPPDSPGLINGGFFLPRVPRQFQLMDSLLSLLTAYYRPQM
ncbi:MAG TPA: carbon-nitrogen hydrolase family protein [Anaerolineales bacterium]|nr:carbon-nitrogen hydrolase family protein [Anaerolineales bacterium]